MVKGSSRRQKGEAAMAGVQPAREKAPDFGQGQGGGLLRGEEAALHQPLDLGLRIGGGAGIVGKLHEGMQGRPPLGGGKAAPA